MQLQAISEAAVYGSRVPQPLCEDALSVAALAALEAERCFDPARNVPLGAWMAMRAKWAVKKFLAAEFTRPLFVPLDDGMAAAADPFRWIIERDHILTTLDGQDAEFAFLAALGTRQADISKRYKMNSTQISQRLEGITRQLARKNPAD